MSCDSSRWSSSGSSSLIDSIRKTPRSIRGRENDSPASNTISQYRKVRHIDNSARTENSLHIFVRVRPLTENESQSCIDVDNNSIILHPPQSQLNGRAQTKVFDFQEVFGPECTQNVVFQNSINNLLPALAEGRDLLFFAYGVTGAGKTFTVEGTPQYPGLLSQTLSSLLSSMKTGSPVALTNCTDLSVSCFEIFNEKIYDLLVPTTKTKKLQKEIKHHLTLGRDTDGRTIVEGANQYIISNESQITELILKANSERHKAETTYNHNSSRSHVVYRMTLSRKVGHPILVSIVDLAGCERTKTIGDDRMRESCNINKSMLVLGRCIRNLANRQQAVPYRESLITRLFKDFFESPGKCAVAAVMVNVTPLVDQFEDTSFSLSFAVDASQCYTASIAPEVMEPDQTPIDPSFRFELVNQMQQYLDNIERCYKSQVDSLMERTRCANQLHSQIENYVARADYEALQQENIELREQLNQALERIKELTNE